MNLGPATLRLALRSLSSVTLRRVRGRTTPFRWSFRQELVNELLRRVTQHAASMGWAKQRTFMNRFLQLPLPGALWGTLDFEEARAGRAPALVVRPRAGADRAVLYLHGGAYLFGSPKTYRELVARLSLAAGAEVVALDYRLMPEHPFSASLEDARSAWAWMCARRPAAHVAAAGDSAGGNLALRLCCAERDAGGPLPAAVTLLCPWTDLSASVGSVVSNAPYDVLTPEVLASWAAAVLEGKDSRSPHASPLFADLSRLPPMLVQVGDAELLLDQVRALVRRVRACGGDVIATEYPGETHDWPLLARITPSGRAAIDEIAAFIRAKTA